MINHFITMKIKIEVKDENLTIIDVYLQIQYCPEIG
jgi:hypothetical protein